MRQRRAAARRTTCMGTHLCDRGDAAQAAHLALDLLACKGHTPLSKKSLGLLCLFRLAQWASPARPRWLRRFPVARKSGRRMAASSIASIPYPERYHLAQRYWEEGPLSPTSANGISDSDQLLLYALSQQATHGPCQEPRPSMFDSAARAKWSAWNELAQQKRSPKVLVVNAIEELAPDWWQWPPLGVGGSEAAGGAAPEGAPAADAPADGAPGPPAAAEAATRPTRLIVSEGARRS